MHISATGGVGTDGAYLTRTIAYSHQATWGQLTPCVQNVTLVQLKDVPTVAHRGRTGLCSLLTASALPRMLVCGFVFWSEW